MRRHPLIPLAAVALALCLGAVSCGNAQTDNAGGGGSSGGSTPGTAAGGGSAFTINTDKCDDYQGTTGISDSEIKIGSSFPQSGIYAAYAEISKGYKAYFEYLNATKGGVKGKKITVVTKDDGYESGRTKTNVQGLIDSDKVFSLYGNVGTPNNLAINPDLNKACVPNLFAATGSQLMGQPAKYPWTIGSIPTYATEGAIYAQYLKDNKPSAKVGILRQNDDAGLGYSDSFKKAIEGTKITVVDEQTYDAGVTDVTSQITKLKNAGADTLLLATITITCPSALKAVADQSGWSPTTYVSATCTSNTLMSLAPQNATNGVLSAFYLMDPVDPQWASNPAMQSFQQNGAKYGLGPKELTDGIVGFGWTLGELLAQTLDKAPALDRKTVMETAYNLKGLTPGVLLPGISVNTNGTADPYPIEQMQIGKYNGKTWDLQGSLQSFEGKTKDYVKS